jgi:hypothetical protein
MIATTTTPNTRNSTVAERRGLGSRGASFGGGGSLMRIAALIRRITTKRAGAV